VGLHHITACLNTQPFLPMMVFQRDPYIHGPKFIKGFECAHQYRFLLAGCTAHRYHLLLAEKEISAPQ
jgi:hypothetical protein